MSNIKEVLVKAPKHYPTLTLDEKELPAIKDWKVGGKYRITVDVEQIGADKGGEWSDDDKKNITAKFKILKACEHEVED